MDPWGKPYVYKSPGDHGEFDIISYGFDGAPGGEGENEDVFSWKGLGGDSPIKKDYFVGTGK